MDKTDPEVITLSQSAFHAEHHRQFDRAYELHSQALQGFRRLVYNPWRLISGRDRRRAARKFLQIHKARLKRLQPLQDGTQTEPPAILPSDLTAQKELQQAPGNGKALISLEEYWLAKYLNDREQSPNLAPDPSLKNLLQSPVPFYTTTLDPTFPTVTHDIVFRSEAAISQTVYYLKVKSTIDDRATQYILEARKPNGYQIPITKLRRASDYANSCITAAVTPVHMHDLSTGSRADHKGRPIDFQTGTPRVIRVQPDRVGKQGWGSRRFMYGGRQFVWVTEEDRVDKEPQTLYEVESVWPKPDSKTGKMEHKVVGGKLAWGEFKLSFKRIAVLHMVGGLDQHFQEFILANQLTRLIVTMYGHD